MRRMLMLVLLLLLTGSCAGSNGDRFFGLGWGSSRSQVLDSLRAWKFTYNEAKARWENGSVRGLQVDKLRTGFDSSDHLNLIEARHERLTSAASQTLFEEYRARTIGLHGQPDRDETASLEQIPVRRLIWDFASQGDMLRDMIILLHFRDVIIFQAGKNLPPLFDFAR